MDTIIKEFLEDYLEKRLKRKYKINLGKIIKREIDKATDDVMEYLINEAEDIIEYTEDYYEAKAE